MEDPLLTLIVLAITFQWGDWRGWKHYYPTILFWGLGNFIYLHVTKDNPLWKFDTIIPTSLADVLMILVIFPCVIFLFFPYFPKRGNAKKLLYICVWVFIFSFIEWWSLQIGHFSYFNGWKLTYSVIFNIGMFPLLLIHHKYPPWAWLISLISGSFIIIYFKIPL